MNDSVLLQVSNLSKTFGSLKAVDRISFQINRGQVVGLIGSNGAGKTTTMRMLATIDPIESGSILINGLDVESFPEKVRPLIGWMPDYFHAYNNTSVREYLDFFARAYDLPPSLILDRIREVMDFTELTELEDRLINKLSKGQTQRLCLARTLISDPQLLILDEPAAGLDPKARLEFRNLVQLLKEKGKTMLISSHILSELGEMCDSLIFMDKGQIVHDGDKKELLHRQDNGNYVYEIRLVNNVTEPLENWLTVHPGWSIQSVSDGVVHASFSANDESEVAEQLRLMCGELPVVEFHHSTRLLEEVFVDILRDKNANSR